MHLLPIKAPTGISDNPRPISVVYGLLDRLLTILRNQIARATPEPPQRMVLKLAREEITVEAAQGALGRERHASDDMITCHPISSQLRR